MFNTVHLVKNIRNNLISSRFFHVPQFLFNLEDIVFNIPPGFVIWSHLHQVHTRDLTLNSHLKKAPKLSYSVLLPGNNKQSVPLALAVFEPTTTSAIRSYFPEEYTTIAFLEHIHAWWLVVNAKERFHPTRIGNALVSNDKIDFPPAISDWLETWNSSRFIGLTKQTFKAFTFTNRAIADLSSDLLSAGYQYILTGRLQTDPLERKFSHYRQMSGGGFWLV